MLPSCEKLQGMYDSQSARSLCIEYVQVHMRSYIMYVCMYNKYFGGTGDGREDGGAFPLGPRSRGSCERGGVNRPAIPFGVALIFTFLYRLAQVLKDFVLWRARRRQHSGQLCHLIYELLTK
jgi:hypothetical protein